MNKRIGMYIPQKVSGESYKAYVATKLPLEPPIKLEILYPYLEKATLALAQLNSIHKTSFFASDSYKIDKSRPSRDLA